MSTAPPNERTGENAAGQSGACLPPSAQPQGVRRMTGLGMLASKVPILAEILEKYLLTRWKCPGPQIRPIQDCSSLDTVTLSA